MKVTIYTDGSSRGNPGPGGYGAVLQFVDSTGKLHERELSQGYATTTNNRMELLGVIVALEALKRPCTVGLAVRGERFQPALGRWLAQARLEEREEGAC